MKKLRAEILFVSFFPMANWQCVAKKKKKVKNFDRKEDLQQAVIVSDAPKSENGYRYM